MNGDVPSPRATRAGPGDGGGVLGAGGEQVAGGAGDAQPAAGGHLLDQVFRIGQAQRGDVLPDEVAGAGVRGAQGQHHHQQPRLRAGQRAVVGHVREHGACVLPLRRRGQQPGHRRSIAVRTAAGALLVLEARCGGGLFGAPGLKPQIDVAGDIGPGGEGACLAVLEVGEECQVGFGALLVGAEELTEFDEFVPQDDGPQIVGDGPLRDPPVRMVAPDRGGAGGRYVPRAGRGRGTVGELRRAGRSGRRAVGSVRGTGRRARSGLSGDDDLRAGRGGRAA
ncbi:hypothetical protein [Streptomyces sp. NPDC057557]|uniref:hypothetical protein n=1 Tax=Streptomyces sp. NPDC057557 TaxID=3346167 RepID=UPI00367EE61F